jgi:hypothetical protein
VNSTAQDEITAYVAGVHEALSELPEHTRLELLEDLAEHLAEVRAEGLGTLVERLGAPEAYAAELLATAGFVGGFPEPPPAPQVSPLESLRADATAFLKRADVKVGPVIGYSTASEFLVLLRPAWWVLRGYLAAMAAAYLLDDRRRVLGLLPRIGDSELVAIALLGGCVIVSIVFGRKAFDLSRWPKYGLWSASTLLVLFAISGFVDADQSMRWGSYDVVGNDVPNPYSNVQDVYVYDKEGKLVEGARLYDQDAMPIQLGNAYCTDPITGEYAHSRNLGYPYCPENVPFGPSASPSSLAPSSTPAPSPSVATPSPSVNVTATVRPSPSR